MDIKDTYEVKFTFLNELRLLKELMIYFSDDEDEYFGDVSYEDVAYDVYELYHHCKYNEKMPTIEFDEDEYRVIQEVLIDAHNIDVGYDLDRSDDDYFFKSLCDLFDVTDIIYTLDSEIEAVDELEEDEEEYIPNPDNRAEC